LIREPSEICWRHTGLIVVGRTKVDCIVLSVEVGSIDEEFVLLFILIEDLLLLLFNNYI